MLDGDIILNSLFSTPAHPPTTRSAGGDTPAPATWPWRLPLPGASQLYRFSREQGVQKPGR